jgi:hypothetical protein
LPIQIVGCVWRSARHCRWVLKNGVIMAAGGQKGQQKYNKNRIFTAIAPTLAPLDFFPDP